MSSDKHSASSDLDQKLPHNEATIYDVEKLDDGVPRQRLGALWTFANKLDRYGVEMRGIERVPPNERFHTRVVDAGIFWFSANCQPTTFALGVLGPIVFSLGFKDSALCILFFNLLGSFPAAWFSAFGPKLGLRQMVIGRFSFGPVTVLIPTFLNCVACVGWSAINTIVAAQILNVVSDDHQLPVAAGIVIVALITLILVIGGYKIVHLYERFAWVPVPIILAIMAGVSAKYMDAGEFGGSGEIEAASCLSFGAAIVGFAIGWCSLAADYSVNMPETTSSWRIFAYVYAGLNVPMILIEILGAAMTTTFVARPDWADLYDASSTGGLLRAGLSPVGGFGRFCLVLLALSIIANNIPNVYSFAMSAQTLHPWIQAIPRLFLSVVCTGIYIGIAIKAATSFESSLDTLLVLLAYWLAIYFVIVAEEHLIFRRGKWSNYAADDYTLGPRSGRLPAGFAAFFALACGIAGAVVGMASVWYVGPIAKMIGLPEFGGDIGFELSGAFAAITYPPARYLEKRYFKC